MRDNYDRNLLSEIKAKKQNSHESVCIFITSMEGLFNRLNQVPSEKEVVDVIRENLLPDYVKALALHELSTISELTKLGKKLENSFLVCAEYKGLSSGKKLMEPDLSMPGFSGHVNTMNSALTCFKCHKPGHKAVACPSVRKLFCYGCGLKDVTRRNCPKCSKNGPKPDRRECKTTIKERAQPSSSQT